MGLAWSDQDCETVRSMRRERWSHKHIARVLGRTPRAVMTKAEELGAVRGRGKTPRQPPSKEGITIRRDELLTYYELGWRVAWFEGQQVGLEWTSQSVPRLP